MAQSSRPRLRFGGSRSCRLLQAATAALPDAGRHSRQGRGPAAAALARDRNGTRWAGVIRLALWQVGRQTTWVVAEPRKRIPARAPAPRGARAGPPGGREGPLWAGA